MTLSTVILAAGRGSRMGDLTLDKPKCLVELAGRPLLHWQLDALRRAGSSDIRLVAGYLQQRLDGPFEKLVNPRWEQTNMVASLACADATLRERTCLVAYSDIAYHHEHLLCLTRTPGDIVVTSDTCWEALWRLRFGDPLLDAETFRARQGLLKDIGAKPQSLGEVQGQFMGLLKITPAGWSHIRRILDGLDPERVDKLDVTALLRLLLQDGAAIGVAPVQGRWVEADSGEDVRLYEQALDGAARENRRFSHDWRTN